jgi:endoglucanase
VILRRTLVCLLIGLGALTAADTLPVISDFDQPFLFAYQSWDKKVTVSDGHAVLHGVTNQGGAGFNQAMDLSASATRSPALRLRVGPENMTATIKVMLMDAESRTATWSFNLSEAGAAWQLIAPASGGDLLHPDKRDKGDIDLARLTQWQLQGDWAGAKPLDVEIDAIVLAAESDVPALAERRARLRQAEEAAQRKRAEELAQAKAAVTHTAQSPWIENVYAVAPDILAVAIRAQDVVPGHLEPYVAQEGDKLVQDGRYILLERGGKRVAKVLGAAQDTLSFNEAITGDPLLEPLVAETDTWSLRSGQEPSFAPTAVERKSKPVDWCMGSDRFAMRHIAYLRLPQPMHDGAAYVLDLSRLNLRTTEHTFVFDPATAWSEAVHVNQIGFRPDDPLKRGFVSVWLGSGGRQSYASGLPFSVIDQASGDSVLRGTTEMAKTADQTEAMNRAPRNWNATDVLRFDFAAVTKPGTYRISIAGIGCSHPFRIADDVWTKAFLVQMQGFYNQRSGIALGPPYSDFRRPRDLHPDDGAAIFQSTCSPLDVANNDEARMKGLEGGCTEQRVPEAWGGYHDAGDWNPRRITHMQNNTELLLELAMLFPDWVDSTAWPLPDQQHAPALLQEVMFEVDCYRRLQLPDGSVRFGIETHGDPRAGDVSWKQTMPMYVFAPDPWSGFIYTAMAARLAGVLERHDATLAATYRDSAIRAMAWSDARWRAIREQPDLAKRWSISDDRNFAAIELYRVTSDKHWLDIFMEETVLTAEQPELFQWGKHVQLHAAFAYALLPAQLADPVLQARARQATIAMADRAIVYADGNAFNLAANNPGKPMFQFFYSVPQTKEMLRAHHLTQDPRYLAAALRSTVFAAGGNPMNATFTVGVGHDWPRHPLKLDARSTGQPAPLGQTVYGNCDFLNWTDGFHRPPWVFTHLDRISTPAARAWPIPEAFFDIFLYPAQTEYTVEGFGENAYAWGYLAARPHLQ